VPCSAGKGTALRSATTCSRPWTVNQRMVANDVPNAPGDRDGLRPMAWPAKDLLGGPCEAVAAVGDDHGEEGTTGLDAGLPPPAPGRSPRPTRNAGASPRRTASRMGLAIPPSVRQARGARAALPRSTWGGLSAMTRRRPAPLARASRRVRATQAATA
jgi:hypothetical protein